MDAQYQLYWAYDKGLGVEKDETLARQWCKKAADNGHAAAAVFAGFDEMFDHNAVGAAKYWETAAQAGEAAAAAELAELYLDGFDGVPMNKARALELFRQAADAGIAKAQGSLGVCYATGNGVPQDAAEAVKWFEKAAAQEDVFAMKNLAVCLRNGNGVAMDKAKAAQWFEKAAAKGNIQAKSCLANMYTEGEGVIVNYPRAEALCREILDSGDQEYRDSAMFDLALLYATKLNDHNKAFPLWQQLAERGDSSAQYNLGLSYHNGWGTAKNDDQALFWWQKAAAQGHENAQHNMELLQRERSASRDAGQYQNISQSTKPAKSGGCYVATAVYGSYDCPQVWTLRRFRDKKLAASWYGRAFIRVYYALSPTIVRLFGRTEWFNRFWRGRLDRMVAALQAQGYEDLPYSDR